MLLLCALIAGSSSAWADYVEVYKLDGTITGGTNSYSEASDITQNEMTWKVVGNTTTNPWRIGGKSLDGVDRTITGQTKFAEALTQIIINHAGTTSDKVVVNSITLTVASDADFTDVIDEIKKTSLSIAKNTEGSIEFTPTAPLTEWAKDSYYKFTINISNPQNSNYAFALKSIVFNKNNGGSLLNESDFALTGDPAALQFDLYNNKTPQTISYTTSSTGAVTSSGGEAFVEIAINQSTKQIVVTPKAQTPDAGPVMVTIKQAADANYEAGSKTFSVEITNSDPDKAGTSAKPYTVAQARAAIDAGAGLTNVYVKGIVYVGGSNLSNGAMNYWISDDGTETDKFEIFKGKGLDGADFASTSDVAIGDIVVVYGNIKKYSSTYEFDSGSKLISITKYTKPVIYADNVTIEAEATSGKIEYTVTNPTDATLTAAVAADCDWISNIQVDAEKVTFTTKVNTGAKRTTTITLSYTGAENKAVTVTQNAIAYASLPFAFDGGRADVESTPGLTQTGLASDYSASPKLKFDGAGDELVLRINEVPGALYFDIKGNGSGSDPWAGEFKVQTSMDGTEYEDLATYTDLTSTKQTELFNLLPSVRYIKWVYTAKTLGNVALGNINLVKENGVKIGDAGYTTFWGMKAYNFTGLTAYVVSEINDNSVTLTEVTSAPAWTGVILKGDAGIYVLEETDSPAEVGTNLLQTSRGGNFGGESASYDLFALAKKGDVVGFYKVKNGVTIPAYKCFLTVNKSSAPEYLSFILGGETTNIADVRSKMEDVKGEVYDLLGRRVAQPTKGLYIVNGKKVVLH